MSADFLTFKEILRLSVSVPITWLAGTDAEARPVRWVTTIIDDAQTGDVLLLRSSLLDAETLQKVNEQGVTALLVVGETELPNGETCGGLAVAMVPESAGDLREIQQLILTVMINKRASVVERGVRIHTQLSQLEAEGIGLAGLAKAMFEISGKGILIQDKRGQFLAEHASSTLLTIWGDVLKQLRSLESLPELLTDRKQAGSQIVIHSQKIPGGLERLILPIVVGEIARGYLSLVGIDGEFDELDHLVLEQGGMVCAVDMARNKAVREVEKRLKGDLLTALLQGNLSSREAALWVQQMGLDLTQSHVALRFAWDGLTAPSRRRLETLVNGEVVRRELRIIVNPMGSEIICFCQELPDTKRPDSALALGQAVMDQAAREYPQVPCRCGIGAKAVRLEDWQSSLRQAGQALELARRLGKQAPLYYPDLSVYRLLFQLEHTPEIITFQEETLGALLEHEGADDLIHTLETYFEHNGNLSQAAEALYIHRNTLIYRMERISSITSLDLDNPEERLAMQLALRIHHMMGSKPD